MFIGRANKTIFLDNIKEELFVEKIIIALENKISLEERKHTKKVSFKYESKKKSPKYPFDLEGLQKDLKTKSNKMVEIKKKVVESSKKSFWHFKRN